MVIALPRLQTASKVVRKRVRVGQTLNYRSLPVGPQRGKDDRREYVRRGRTPSCGSAVPRTSGIAEPGNNYYISMNLKILKLLSNNKDFIKNFKPLQDVFHVN